MYVCTCVCMIYLGTECHSGTYLVSDSVFVLIFDLFLEVASWHPTARHAQTISGLCHFPGVYVKAFWNLKHSVTQCLWHPPKSRPSKNTQGFSKGCFWFEVLIDISAKRLPSSFYTRWLPSRNLFVTNFPSNARWTLKASWNSCKMSWASKERKKTQPPRSSSCCTPEKNGPLLVINEGQNSP